MCKYSRIRRPAGIVAATASGLWLSFSGSAAAQSPMPEVTVTIFAEHYVLAGRAIDDLDVLDNAVSPGRPHVVRLYACGGRTARAQQAAAHRFRDLYLELRVLDTDSPACRFAAGPRLVPVSPRLGERPTGIDDEAVDRWWNELMP